MHIENERIVNERNVFTLPLTLSTKETRDAEIYYAELLFKYRNVQAAIARLTEELEQEMEFPGTLEEDPLLYVNQLKARRRQLERIRSEIPARYLPYCKQEEIMPIELYWEVRRLEEAIS